MSISLVPHIDYWLSVASPWAWLGSARFVALAEAAGATVEVRPIELGEVFAATGGTPFAQRSAARRSYRQLELARWSEHLGVPIVLEPRYYPVDRLPASCLVIAARENGADALALSHAILRAIWVEERDIACWDTLAAIAQSAGFDGDALVPRAQKPAVAARFRADTRSAVEAQVFGAPTYVLDGELFWGQDRLDFLAQRLGLAGQRRA